MFYKIILSYALWLLALKCVYEIFRACINQLVFTVKRRLIYAQAANFGLETVLTLSELFSQEEIEAIMSDVLPPIIVALAPNLSPEIIYFMELDSENFYSTPRVKRAYDMIEVSLDIFVEEDDIFTFEAEVEYK